jgi:radical SAM protein with 4Fe4S-binding SPASM domain
MVQDALPVLQDASCNDGCGVSSLPVSRVAMTENLERLLTPQLHGKEPIFTSRLQPPKPEEKVYALSPAQLQEIRDRRGSVVDLHPGMGGVAPDALREFIAEGAPLTSLDFMVTRDCNFACTWCYAGSKPGEQDFLPFAKLEELTADAADAGVRLFILTGGEPLVYRDPALGNVRFRGDHFFQVADMIAQTYKGTAITPKILTFDDVALINECVAGMFAERGIGLCTKGDTLHPELQDFKVNQPGAFRRMQQGYQRLRDAGYGSDPALRLVVNSVLDQTTFDGMVDVHDWVLDNGWDHSIVPIHYCGNAGDEDQEAGIHSPHVKVLYELLARIDAEHFDMLWEPWSAFTYDKTCNRNMSGLHIRANGDVTACSESPGRDETRRYTFGNVFEPGFSLLALARSEELARYRMEFAGGTGEYVCAPEVCDLNANDLCRGGCAVRSAYSYVDRDTGLIVESPQVHKYSDKREDPLCPAWTVLAQRQGVLQPGLLEGIHTRLVERTQDPRVTLEAFPYQERAV